MKKNLYVRDKKRILIGFSIAVIFHLLIIISLYPFLKNFKKIEDIKPMIINFEGNLSAPPLKRTTIKKIEKKIKQLKKEKITQKNKSNIHTIAKKQTPAIEKKTVPKQPEKLSEIPINKTNEIKTSKPEHQPINEKTLPVEKTPEKSLFNDADFAALDQALQSEQEIAEQAADEKNPDLDKSGISWDSTGEKRRVEYRENPEIPEWVEKEGLKLEVVFVFTVFPNGNIGSIDIVKSSGYSEFDSLMQTAFKRWKFNPVQSSALSKGSIAFRTEF